MTKLVLSDVIDMMRRLTLELVGHEHLFSKSMQFRILRYMRDGIDVEAVLTGMVENAIKNSGNPLYWLHNKATDSYDKACELAKDKNVRLCKICRGIFRPSKLSTVCCSEVCMKESRRMQGLRLSESKKLYNSKDPIQYAERHGITVIEAATRISNFVNEGTIRRPEYWIKRGHTEEEAKQLVSDSQSKVSPRCTAYWVERGYSTEAAKKKVSEVQSETGKSNTDVVRSTWLPEFYLERGFSYLEAHSLAYDAHKLSTTQSAIVNTSAPTEVKRKRNVFCIEYWQSRHPDDFIAKYEEFRNSMATSYSFRSKIADEFCSELSKSFEGDSLYFGDKEFGKYIPEVGYRKYDFVNTTKGFCVEFHGNYWHEEGSEYDRVKREFMEELGFKFFVVWESEYKANKAYCINELLEKINEN